MTSLNIDMNYEIRADYAALVADFDRTTQGLFEQYPDRVTQYPNFARIVLASTDTSSLIAERATVTDADHSQTPITITDRFSFDGASDGAVYQVEEGVVTVTSFETDKVDEAETGEPYLSGPITRVATSDELQGILAQLHDRRIKTAHKPHTPWLGRVASFFNLLNRQL